MIKFIRKHRRMKSSTINEHRAATTIARFIDERCKEINDALIPRIFFFFLRKIRRPFFSTIFFFMLPFQLIER